MTESQWLMSEDPVRMLRFLRFGATGPVAGWWARLVGREGASPHRLRLFTLACYRRAGLLGGPAGADGLPDHLPRDPEDAARDAARAVADRTARRAGEAAWEDATRWATDWDPITAHRASSAAREAEGEVDRAAEAAAEAAAQCGLLRDIFGNPFRPVAADPSWRTSAAVDLARAACHDGTPVGGELEPVRLAVLADALEEAGCGEEAVLRHCRGFDPCPRCGGTGRLAYDLSYYPPPTETCPDCRGGAWVPLRAPHVRGCWVVDLVLGED